MEDRRRFVGPDDKRRSNKGRPPRPLSKDQILLAMSKTKSNRAASRFLNCSYIHYKTWAKQYFNEEGVSLFEAHKNQCGKGIPKFLTGHNAHKEFNIMDVVEGRISSKHFSPDKLKRKLIEEGIVKEECALCGFHERRVSDFKIPLILNFKDGNTEHYGLNNVRFLCYNCFYLNVGNIFNRNEMKQLETHETYNINKTDAVNFELDEYQLEQLNNLGLYEPPRIEDDGLDLISRI